MKFSEITPYDRLFLSPQDIQIIDTAIDMIRFCRDRIGMTALQNFESNLAELMNERIQDEADWRNKK